MIVIFIKLLNFAYFVRKHDNRPLILAIIYWGFKGASAKMVFKRCT